MYIKVYYIASNELRENPDKLVKLLENNKELNTLQKINILQNEQYTYFICTLDGNVQSNTKTKMTSNSSEKENVQSTQYPHDSEPLNLEPLRPNIYDSSCMGYKTRKEYIEDKLRELDYSYKPIRHFYVEPPLPM